MIQPSQITDERSIRWRTYRSSRGPDEGGDSPEAVQSFSLPATMRPQFNEHTSQSAETIKTSLSILCVQARSAT
jgi:hypothetical protein